MHKKPTRLWLPIVALASLTVGVQAQENWLVPQREKLQVRGSEGDSESILRQIREQKPSLKFQRASLDRLGTKGLPGHLVYTVKQNGKVLHQSEKVPLTLQQSIQGFDLARHGLDESMLTTWEKQGFIRRQVGRIENPEKQTGRLATPEPPGGSSSRPLSQPDKKLEQQGFIRRQVGRIPKGEYQVEVRLTTPQDKGNSQPAVFLLDIL